ncbi:MAG: replication-relaxation family protein [Actinobacteria bacterium]|nr:replication-relaxation family protein [Actinomycetota bacterium]
MSAAVTAGVGLPEITAELIASVGGHRVLSTEQLRTIHLPERSLRRTQQVLASLESAGLLSHVDARVAPRRLWFLSEAGADLAVDAGGLERRPKVLEPRDAAGALRAHTLAVNDAAICFVRAARERGDEFGGLSWRHEVAHPLNAGRGTRRRTLFADALLTYLQPTATSTYMHQVFLELDRATLSVDRLAAELSRYADLYRLANPDGGPMWKRSYPTFPRVLCVLAGNSREALGRRRDITLALLRQDPQVGRTPELQIYFCLLEDLEDEGPFAPIFRELHDPKHPVDWLGDPGGEEATT